MHNEEIEQKISKPNYLDKNNSFQHNWEKWIKLLDGDKKKIVQNVSYFKTVQWFLEELKAELAW